MTQEQEVADRIPGIVLRILADLARMEAENARLRRRLSTFEPKE